MNKGNRYARWITALAWIMDEKKQRTQVSLAQEVGVRKESMNAIIRQRKPASQALQDAITAALGYSYEDMLTLGQWILDGKDPEEFMPERGTVKPFTQDELERAAERGYEIEKKMIKKVPLISWVMAGDMNEIEDIFHPGQADEWITVVTPVGENSFALRVHGDSMSPEFNPGDIIIVDHSVQHESGDYVVAKIETDSQSGEATFKQFVRDAGRTYLKPLNRQYPVMDMTGVKFKIVGKVVQKIKVY